MKPTPSLPVIGGMLAALGVIAIAAWIAWSQIARDQPPAGNPSAGVVQTNVTIGGPFTLTDHRGQTVTDANYRGRYMLVYFGYGFCPDVCPTELANIAVALDQLGEKAALVQPLFITVDPARDTVEFLADYVPHFYPSLVGLTGTPEQIKQVAKAYRVYYARSKTADSPDYLMDHSTFVYFMGPDGQYLNLFKRQTDPKEIAATIGQLIAKHPPPNPKSS